MITEWQCDRCRFWERASIPKKEMMKWLRKEGWSIGKKVLCPACNGRFHKMMKERSE